MSSLRPRHKQERTIIGASARFGTGASAALNCSPDERKPTRGYEGEGKSQDDGNGKDSL